MDRQMTFARLVAVYLRRVENPTVSMGVLNDAYEEIMDWVDQQPEWRLYRNSFFEIEEVVLSENPGS